MRVVNYTVVGSNHSNLTYVFSGLQEYTVYEFSVAAHTSIGKGTAKTVDSRTNEAGLYITSVFHFESLSCLRICLFVFASHTKFHSDLCINWWNLKL